MEKDEFDKLLEKVCEKVREERKEAFKPIAGEVKLLVVGSRSIKKLDLSKYISDDVDIIITGGAAGVDTIAEQYADKHRISKIVLRPHYNKFRRNAPLIRNHLMVELSNKVLAFWDGKSRGTQKTINFALQKGKAVEVVQLNG